MVKKVRTSRGNMIDFDLLKVKNSMSSNPKTVEVKHRENFIDKKMKNRVRKTVQNMSERALDERNKKLEEEKLNQLKKDEEITVKKTRKKKHNKDKD